MVEPQRHNIVSRLERCACERRARDFSGTHYHRKYFNPVS